MRACVEEIAAKFGEWLLAHDYNEFLKGREAQDQIIELLKS